MASQGQQATFLVDPGQSVEVTETYRYGAAYVTVAQVRGPIGPGRTTMQTGYWAASAEVMTRFKELRRIEAAIEHRNEAELRWALDYCQIRLKILTMKRQEKRWRQIEKQIRATLLAIEADSN